MSMMMRLKEDFPEMMKEKVWDLFVEFEDKKTKEARFAKAIDKIDAMVHELDYKKRWKGWTEEAVRNLYGKGLEEFPELQEVLDKTMKYCAEKGYFDQ